MLALTELSGTLLDCAHSYGEESRYAIRGFYNRELTPNDTKLSYARRCIKFMEESTPSAYTWCKAMARGTNLTLEDVTLLFLHEENFHANHGKEGHCTAVVSVRDSSRFDESISGQNWDWNNSYYQLPSVLRTKIKNGPSLLTYQYPGLPFCCGVNDHGLSLVWTGAGYLPAMQPEAGIPTYALVTEILMKKSVDEAARFMEKATKTAGCFIFLLADDRGDSAVLEGVPGHTQIARGASSYFRSNLFMLDETKRMSSQHADTAENCVQREILAKNLTQRWDGDFVEDIVRSILRTPPIFRADDMRTMTIDSIVTNASARTLSIARGGKHSNLWNTYAF